MPLVILSGCAGTTNKPAPAFSSGQTEQLKQRADFPGVAADYPDFTKAVFHVINTAEEQLQEQKALNAN